MRAALTLLSLAIFGVALVSAAGAMLTQESALGPVPSDYGIVLHSLGGKFVVIAAAVVFLMMLDAIFMPYLRIEDAFYCREPWSSMPPEVRGAFIWGWFTVFAAIILGFAWGGSWWTLGLESQKSGNIITCPLAAGGPTGHLRC